MILNLFNQAKTENTSKTINLKDLNINNGNYPPHSEDFIGEFYTIPYNNVDNLALAYYNYHHDWKYYKLVETEFNLKIEYTQPIGSSYFYEQKINNYYPINLSIINNNNLNWTFYLEINLSKIEFKNHTPRDQDKSSAYRFINNIKSNVYKIVLNAR